MQNANRNKNDNNFNATRSNDSNTTNKTLCTEQVDNIISVVIDNEIGGKIIMIMKTKLIIVVNEKTQIMEFLSSHYSNNVDGNNLNF